MSGKIHPLPSPADGSDFDAARVAAIREDIRAGRYEVRPERIADGLLNSVRELLDPGEEVMNTLLQHLRAEMSGIEDFLALLDEEHLAMEEGRLGELAALTSQKAQLQARMAELDQEREAVQAALSFEPGRADADSAARAAGEECSAAWAALLALAEEAKASNERNANMVFAHLDFTQNALRFLRASGQPFYGPDGTRKTPAGAGTRLAPG